MTGTVVVTAAPPVITGFGLLSAVLHSDLMTAAAMVIPRRTFPGQ